MWIWSGILGVLWPEELAQKLVAQDVLSGDTTSVSLGVSLTHLCIGIVLAGTRGVRAIGLSAVAIVGMFIYVTMIDAAVLHRTGCGCGHAALPEAHSHAGVALHSGVILIVHAMALLGSSRRKPAAELF